MDVTNIYNIDTRVYIAGILVPTTSVTINSAFNTLPRCTVALPPDRRLFGLGRSDRIPIQIFLANTLTRKPDNYVLIFEGEISDFGYVNSAISREFIVNGVSNLSFMQDVNFEMLTDLESFGRSTKTGSVANAEYLRGHPNTAFPASLFTHGMVPDYQNERFIEYPVEYLKNIAAYLEGDSSVEPKSIVGKFYSDYAKNKIKFGSRFPEVPYFDDTKASWNSKGTPPGFPLLSGVQQQTISNVITGLLTNGPHHGSIYEFMNYIVANMEYEMAFFNAPTYDTSRNAPNSFCLKPMFYEALPPACNVIFRGAITDIRASERVASLPTRIRTRDVAGLTASMNLSSNSVLRDFGMLDYWPTTHSDASTQNGKTIQQQLSEELLDLEKFTGPRLEDINAPSWLSYINPKTFDLTKDNIGRQLLQHLYLLRRYQGRTLSVNCNLQPFITPGFPTVVYDSLTPAGQEGYTFIGQVTAVSHVIGKGQASTSVELSFVRMFDESEELANPLQNSLAFISKEVTHKEGPMSEIYQKLLGCNAVSTDVLTQLCSSTAQNDPLSMYLFNERKLTSLEQYSSFIGATVEEGGRKLSGSSYLSDRHDGSVLTTLNKISSSSEVLPVYEVTRTALQETLTETTAAPGTEESLEDLIVKGNELTASVDTISDQLCALDEEQNITSLALTEAKSSVAQLESSVAAKESERQVAVEETQAALQGTAVTGVGISSVSSDIATAAGNSVSALAVTEDAIAGLTSEQQLQISDVSISLASHKAQLLNLQTAADDMGSVLTTDVNYAAQRIATGITDNDPAVMSLADSYADTLSRTQATIYAANTELSSPALQNVGLDTSVAQSTLSAASGSLITQNALNPSLAVDYTNGLTTIQEKKDAWGLINSSLTEDQAALAQATTKVAALSQKNQKIKQEIATQNAMLSTAKSTLAFVSGKRKTLQSIDT